MFDFEVKGINRLSNALRKLAGLNREILEPETKKWADQTAKTLRQTPYPARRPGQTYTRKGKLTGSWRHEQRGAGVWSIVNRASNNGQPYAQWVVGDNQSWMHRGRWWKARDIIEGRMPKLIEALKRKIEQVFASGG